MGVEMQVASAFVGLMAANKAKSAYEMEAQSYEEARKMESIKTSQQVVERDRRLRAQLASLDSSMAAQGITIGTSASISALENDEKKLASADISSIKLMGASNRRKYGLSAQSSKIKGESAVLGSYAKTAAIGYDIATG